MTRRKARQRSQSRLAFSHHNYLGVRRFDNAVLSPTWPKNNHPRHPHGSFDDGSHLTVNNLSAHPEHTSAVWYRSSVIFFQGVRIVAVRLLERSGGSTQHFIRFHVQFDQLCRVDSLCMWSWRNPTVDESEPTSVICVPSTRLCTRRPRPPHVPHHKDIDLLKNLRHGWYHTITGLKRSFDESKTPQKVDAKIPAGKAGTSF